jgi:trehalose/maltose hydrolase-like predicted phosphorylase
MQFNKSFAHIKPPFMTWNEKLIGGHPHFITGAGGYLQNIVFGYGGIRIYADLLAVNPVLPPDAEYIKLRKVRRLPQFC